MKHIGLGLLIAGFVWLLIDVATSFTSYQHSLWIRHSQNLPAGESIERDDAVSSMRELSLGLKNRHRHVVLPGCLMIAGGLLIYYSIPKTREPEPPKQGGDGDAQEAV